MIELNTIYPSRFNGNFYIINYINSRKVFIRFIDTGYTMTTEASKIRKGNVKDKLKPVIHGVGFIGDGDFKPSTNGKHSKAYATWKNMLLRCYDNKAQELHPTYKGCTVCDKWHNFQNFAEWHKDNYIEGRHLDKDIKVSNSKVYSPFTCLFVTQLENNVKAKAKSYKFINPLGVVTFIYNLSCFCKGNNLTDSHMSLVHLGKEKQHKGWTKA